MILITFMIIMVKLITTVISYYLKRDSKNEAKLQVMYPSWSKIIRLQFLFTSLNQILHEKFQKILEKC